MGGNVIGLIGRNHQYGMDIYFSETQLQLRTGVSYQQITPYYDINMNEWYHVVFRYESNNQMSYYVNGQFIASKNVDQVTDFSNTEALMFGKNQSYLSGSSRNLNGKMDDINVYNYALSEEEILELYNAPDPKQLIGSWTFDDGTANDVSGNENHGTVFNGATLTTDRFGNENSAFSFDGMDDFIQLNNEITVAELDEWSFAGWIKHERGEHQTSAILSGNQLKIYSNNLNRLAYYDGTGSIYSDVGVVESEWTHVGMTVNRTMNKINFYINGEPAGEKDIDGSFIGGYQITKFGTYQEVGVDQLMFKGAMDDINIYNYTLSESEITELYNVEDPKQLIGSWTFNDSTTNDHSGNDYHGTAINGAISITDRFGNENFAYSFDGIDDYISLSGCENFATEKGTIAFWMKAQDHSRGVFKFYSTQADEHHNHDYIRSYINPNGKIDLIVEDEDVAELHVQYDLDLEPDGYLNEWLYIAWTQDGNGVKLYINGEEKPLEYITNNSNWWSGHLNITHALIGNCWGYFDGNIDDFQIYNYALSEFEIQKLYNASDPTLIGSWEFNDGTADDNSGHDNHGVISGVTLASDRFGRENLAFNFNGDEQYIDIPDQNAYNFPMGQDFSFTFWMKPGEAQPSDYSGLIANGAGSDYVLKSVSIQ